MADYPRFMALVTCRLTA